LRAGEIFNLSWTDIDLSNDIIFVKDTKSKRNRNVVMTSYVKEMLKDRKGTAISGLVFPSRTGERITEVSRSFDRAVAYLGFNKGITDRRQKVVFHTLRHTYASWSVMSGVNLYTVQRLLGHSTIAMTERYSHLAPDHFKKAASTLEDSIRDRQRKNNIVRFEEIQNKAKSS
jgi:integrase